MKTVAEVKRAFKIGVKIHTTYHQAFAGRDEKGGTLYKDEDKGVRELSIVQTTQFALKTTRTDGKVVDSWCAYPKASQTRFNPDGSFTILETDYRQGDKGPLIPILTYRIVDDTPDPDAHEFQDSPDDSDLEVEKIQANYFDLSSRANKDGERSDGGLVTSSQF